MIYFVDGLLWMIALALGMIAAQRSRAILNASIREGISDTIKLIPRIMLGVIGSGYIAAILPAEVVGRWLGADSGVTGLCIAVVGGAFYNPDNTTFPASYQDKFFFADYCFNYIKVLDPVTGQVTQTFATDIDRPLCLLAGNNGSLYYISRGGMGGGSVADNTGSNEPATAVKIQDEFLA